MEKMKKVFAILLVFVVVFTVVACNGTTTDTNTNNGDTATDNGGASTDSGGSTDSNVSAKDTLTVAFTQDRGTLDPMYMLGYDSLNAMRNIYETLWDFDRAGNMVWMLATGLEFIEPTVWHISIREGITFADGSTFNADDALFSILRGNKRVGEPPYLPELDMENSKVLDEYTVELIFNSYDLSYVAGMASLFMIDVESFDEDTMATTPNGTGPYVLTDYVINSHIDFKARDGYWGEAPKIPNLHFIVLAEDAQRVNALQTGTADISRVPFQDIEFVQTLPGVTVEITNAAQGMSKALYMNTSEHSVFYDNVDARQAVAMAIDRQAIVDIAYSGFADVSRLPLSMGNVDVEERFCDMGVYGTGYDPEGAKALAESAGLMDKDILLINNGSASDVVMCELVQANLREIGVTCTVQSLDPGSWLSYAFDPTAYDMCIDFTSAPSATLAQGYYAWATYHVGGSYLTSPWPGNERYKELIDGIMAVSDPTEISNRYMELTEIHTNAMLWFTLVDMKTADAYNSDLKGWAPYLMGNVNYSQLSW